MENNEFFNLSKEELLEMERKIRLVKKVRSEASKKELNEKKKSYLENLEAGKTIIITEKNKETNKNEKKEVQYVGMSDRFIAMVDGKKRTLPIDRLVLE